MMDIPSADHASRLAVDLRSDTVTRPTPEMLARMLTAELGDDGLEGDPTVGALEAGAASMLGKEASLFVPSCTMANLLAVLAQAPRHEQLVLESSAHMYTSERGAATLTGVFYLGVPGQGGAMDTGVLQETLAGGGHKLRSALVAMETSHNNAGGTVLPLDHMRSVSDLARQYGAAVHLDGARLCNAAVALDVPPSEIARHADTVSLCLSKGLSAPVGAVLAGTRALVARARVLRRMVGGTQRQAGVVAAAGLVAIDAMRARLAEDHARARNLSAALNALGGPLLASEPQTNIVQVDVRATGRDSAFWVAALEGAGLRVRPWGAQRLRCVTHRHIDDASIDQAVAAFDAVARSLSRAAAGQP
ncbi:threonine aldolase family protein [Orrella dioscoreae]|uniref:Low-specificity L-threonine aldolase n=1 Tax=Orrella dioscoreae TaxID=1851544 RepID=A0A1C3K6X6_9BURK|nr:Low-specificity L-threonine aldolase [Orrella dioscoreae]SOE46054.1 Low-specificity L-threonine aldolase [Orrella dioscoreae]